METEEDVDYWLRMMNLSAEEEWRLLGRGYLRNMRGNKVKDRSVSISMSMDIW